MSFVFELWGQKIILTKTDSELYYTLKKIIAHNKTLQTNSLSIKKIAN